MAMNYRTEKDDWLNSALAQNKNSFVSGHPTFSTRLGLPDKAITTLRWFGNRRVAYQPLLVVETSVASWPAVEQALRQSAKARELSEWLPTQRAITLLFSEEETRPSELPSGQDFDELNRFRVSTDGSSFVEVDSDNLVEFFRSIKYDFVRQAGTTKEINKTRNDAFQLWTGKNLSRFLSVGDIDALNTESKKMYELKRVVESVTTWEPYLDEASQYVALKSISQSAEYTFRLLSYNVKDNTSYGLHDLREVSRTEIAGRRRIMKAESKTLWQDYRSKRRRQANREY